MVWVFLRLGRPALIPEISVAGVPWTGCRVDTARGVVPIGQLLLPKNEASDSRIHPSRSAASVTYTTHLLTTFAVSIPF